MACTSRFLIQPLSGLFTCAGPWLSHLCLQLILLDSKAQLPRVHTRDRHTSRNPRRLGPTSPHDPHLSKAIAELVRPLLPWLRLVTHSLFRRTPSVRLRLGGPRHAEFARPVPGWTFSGVGTPDVPSEPPRLGDRGVHARTTVCAPLCLGASEPRPHTLSLVTRGGSCPHYPRTLFLTQVDVRTGSLRIPPSPPPPTEIRPALPCALFSAHEDIGSGITSPVGARRNRCSFTKAVSVMAR